MTRCIYCKHYKYKPHEGCKQNLPTKIINWELHSTFKDCCSFEKSDDFLY